MLRKIAYGAELGNSGKSLRKDALGQRTGTSRAPRGVRWTSSWATACLLNSANASLPVGYSQPNCRSRALASTCISSGEPCGQTAGAPVLPRPSTRARISGQASGSASPDGSAAGEAYQETFLPRFSIASFGLVSGQEQRIGEDTGIGEVIQRAARQDAWERRGRAEQEGTPTKLFQRKPELRQFRQATCQCQQPGLRQVRSASALVVDGAMFDQALAVHHCVRGAHTLVQDALMCAVLVNQVETGIPLQEEQPCPELPQQAQRR